VQHQRLQKQQTMDDVDEEKSCLGKLLLSGLCFRKNNKVTTISVTSTSNGETNEGYIGDNGEVEKQKEGIIYGGIFSFTFYTFLWVWDGIKIRRE
jgi:hypothetical protein